jgi:hypothetical protein
MAELRSKIKIKFAVLTLQQIQELKEMPLSSYSIEASAVVRENAITVLKMV